ncbi:MAG: hypothetical protein ACP5K1_00575 [Candidatus Bathyarchaeia archaeon]
MKIVQTALSEAEHKLLEDYARKRGKTIKEVVREAIELMLEGKVAPEDPIFKEPPAAQPTGGREHVSTKHDEYLYGGAH